MRLLATAVFWLAATIALVVAIPTAWTQRNIVDEDGYAALAQKAAGDPALQSAVAAELTVRARGLITERGGPRHAMDSSVLHEAATAFTIGPSFPPLFVQVNRAAHGWLFSNPRSGDGQWAIDVAPMLKDSSFQQILSSYNVTVPATLMVPLPVSAPQSVHQGQLWQLAAWGPWVSSGAMAMAGVCGLLMLLVARRRGKALSSLAVSALLVGAAGWVVIEVGGRYINDALNRTNGGVHRIAEVMVRHAEDSLHSWLNLTLVAGAVLAVSGVLAAVLGSLIKELV